MIATWVQTINLSNFGTQPRNLLMLNQRSVVSYPPSAKLKCDTCLAQLRFNASTSSKYRKEIYNGLFLVILAQ